MLKIAVLVSGGGTNLQAIIDAQKSNKIVSGKVVHVISSNKDAYAITRAKENNIDYSVLCKQDFKDSQQYTKELTNKLKDINPDLIVLAGFMCILTKEIFHQFENKIINVHPSLIPSFCGDGYYGIKVHEKALEYGVKISGATVHFVNEITDGGAIIMQKSVEVLNDDTPQELQRRIMEQAEWDILPKSIELFCSGKIEVVGRNTIIKE